MKQGYDDGLFTESGRSLADVDLDDELADDEDDELDDGWDDEEDDPLDDDPLRDDDAGRRAAM